MGSADEVSETKAGRHEHAELAAAIRHEHELSFRDALRLYPTAIGWSVFVSLGVVMLAFDPQLIGNLYAIPQFQSTFGYQYEGGVRYPDSMSLLTTRADSQG